MSTRLARPGSNCHRVEPASRFAFLVDAASYYTAFAEAAERARTSITILGWDFDARVRLRRENAPPGLPDELGAFLHELVRREPRLHVRVLAWDISVVFGLDRAFLLDRLKTHDRRLRFELDSEHPLGGASHQKIAVIDDRVAFCGGLDFTGHRWDTRAHRFGDRRRIEKGDSRPYRPFHDVQIVCDGPAAAALGELARQRWELATGRSLRPDWVERTRANLRSLPVWPRRDEPPRDPEDPWPASAVPHLRDVDVAILRTEPADAGRPAVREVEQHFVDAIRSTRRAIYIENQYLTSSVAGEALAELLQRPDPPDVVIVQPLRCQGWLEENTVGILRTRLVERLREVDRHGRLRVACPVVPGPPGTKHDGGVSVAVHSKVLVVDDALVRVGSANLSNRSMSLDTECDVSVESLGRTDVARGITSFRDRLLAEHLGVAESLVASEVVARGSLVAAMDALSGGDRTLVTLETKEPAWMGVLGPALSLADPETPREVQGLAQAVVREEARRLTPATIARGVVLIALLSAFALAWNFAVVGDELGPRSLEQVVEPWRGSPLAAGVALVAFVVGGLVAFPVTLLIAATVLAYGAAWGSVIAFVGAFTSAMVNYVLGRAVGRHLLRRLGGQAANRISRLAARHGFVAIAITRVVPLAPFSIVNVVAGASHIRPLDFVFGTLLGLVPAVAAAAVLAEVVTSPARYGLVVLGLSFVALATAAAWYAWRSRRGKT